MKIYCIEFTDGKNNYKYIPEVFWSNEREALEFATKHQDRFGESFEIISFVREK